MSGFLHVAKCRFFSYTELRDKAPHIRIKEGNISMAVFFNQASLTYNDVVTNSNIVSGEIVGALNAEKNALIETYRQGDTVTYVVSITNSSDAAYTNLTLTDNLGTYTVGTTAVTPLDYVEGSLAYYNNGVLTPAMADASGTDLVITGITVPANGNALVIYQAQLNEYAPLETGSQITNTVEISNGCDNVLAEACETISVAEEPNLSITKSLSPEVVVNNSEITYTLVLQNTGNTAAEGIVVTDVFDPVLSDISVTYNGTPWVLSTNYTYDETTGVFRTIEGQITLPAATFTQDEATGVVTVNPSVAVIRITGTI